MNFKPFALGAIAGFVLAVAPSCAKSTCPSTCSGCCTPDGACRASSDSTCGAMGQACVDCAARGATCDPAANACSGSPDGGQNSCKTTCAGCCQGELCLPFSAQEPSHCGEKGGACEVCKTGEVCSMGTCARAPPSVTGTPCLADSECSPLGDAGTCRRATSPGGIPYPMGYCTRPCAVLSHCAPDAVCVGPLPGEASALCLSRCADPDTQSSCRGDYFCFGLTSSTGGACWLVEPFLPDAGPPYERVGSECTSSSMCQPPATPDAGHGVCIPETLSDGGPTGFTGGYCTGDCTLDPRLCGADGGAICVPIGNGSFLCEKTCSGPGQGRSDCRSGYVCYGYSLRTPDGGLRPSAVGACEPSCDVPGSLYACAVGAYCDGGYCVR